MPIWALFLLILIGSFAILAEFFVPAFGIVGVAGLTIAVVAVVLGFSQHPEPWGVILLLTALVVVPTVVLGGFRRFPKSFFGRRMILTTDENDAPSETEAVRIGTEGEALTDLHPIGVARLRGERKSVVTGGEYLEAGTVVEVIAVEGARIVVRRKNNVS
ncbi:MAG: NfeD family protein [Alkalispirochaetaceae bacterium]